MEATPFNKKRILITGGSGFIGSHAVRFFVDAGASVAIIIHPNHTPDRIRNLLGNIAIFESSITDETTIGQSIKKFAPDFVLHFAALLKNASTEALYETNVIGTRALITSLKQSNTVKRFVALGTLEECAGGRAPYRENDREIPLSPYSLTKLFATRLIEYSGRIEGFPTLILRPSVVYGPGQNTGMFIPDLISACLEKRDFEMTLGEQTRDFLFVEDLMLAIAQGLTKPIPAGTIIHVGSGNAIPIRTIAEKIHTLLKKPNTLHFGAIPYQRHEPMHYSVDIQRAQQLLGWEVQTPLDDGLKKTIEWYTSH